jgi:hypothetical protein
MELPVADLSMMGAEFGLDGCGQSFLRVRSLTTLDIG